MLNSSNRLQIAITLLVIALGVAIGAFTSHYNQSVLKEIFEQKISQQNDYLIEILEITGRSGLDEASSLLVKDCSRRSEYESLLVRLNSLSQKDLFMLQNLNELCGSFYAEAKAHMVAKLERELEYYNELINFLNELTTNNLEKYHVTIWSEIATLERTRSELLNEQSGVQTEIINLLIQKNSTQSQTIQDQVKNAQQIGVLLANHDSRIDELRNSLIE